MSIWNNNHKSGHSLIKYRQSSLTVIPECPYRESNQTYFRFPITAFGNDKLQKTGNLFQDASGDNPPNLSSPHVVSGNLNLDYSRFPIKAFGNDKQKKTYILQVALIIEGSGLFPLGPACPYELIYPQLHV